eukprot:364955-Chlamydomonas_euryale.AAC.6
MIDRGGQPKAVLMGCGPARCNASTTPNCCQCERVDILIPLPSARLHELSPNCHSALRATTATTERAVLVHDKCAALRAASGRRGRLWRPRQRQGWHRRRVHVWRTIDQRAAAVNGGGRAKTGAGGTGARRSDDALAPVSNVL